MDSNIKTTVTNNFTVPNNTNQSLEDNGSVIDKDKTLQEIIDVSKQLFSLEEKIISKKKNSL